MALDKTKKSNRLLQSKRYTMESSTDAQEAFTRTLDINAGDVYIREDFVPSTSGSLPYSGSGQNELTIQSASVDIVKYYYQFPKLNVASLKY